MRAIWTIAENELRLIFKDRSVWLNLIIIPIAIAFAVGMANGALSSGGDTTPSLPVDILDNDNTPTSTALIEAIGRANANLLLCSQTAQPQEDPCSLYEGEILPALTEESANERLVNGTTLATLIIPAGFEGAVNGGNAELVYRSDEEDNAPSYILQAVQAAVLEMGGVQVAANTAGEVLNALPALQLTSEQIATITDAARAEASALWQRTPARVTLSYTDETPTEAAAPTGQGGFRQSIPGIGTMYVMFAVLPAAVALMLERKQWTFQRTLTLPVTRAQFLGGKLLARFLYGMIQYGILFVFGAFLGVRYGNDPIALLLTMILFVFCMTAITLALTTLLRSAAQADSIALLITLTLAPLGGAWWSLDIVPGWMRTFGHLSPVAWAMDSYTSLIFFGGTLLDVLPYLGVLLLIGLVAFGFGMWRLRYE